MTEIAVARKTIRVVMPVSTLETLRLKLICHPHGPTVSSFLKYSSAHHQSHRQRKRKGRPNRTPLPV